MELEAPRLKQPQPPGCPREKQQDHETLDPRTSGSRLRLFAEFFNFP